MPAVTESTMIDSKGEVVTDFFDSVGTTSVSYTYSNTQTSLFFRNESDVSITVTVNGSPTVVTRYSETTITAEFTSFSVQSASGVRAFYVRTIRGVTTNNVSSTSLNVISGTETAPSISAIGDANTGIYFPAAETVAITNNGSESFRIKSNGNVGIGTTSPTRKLEIDGSGIATPPLRIVNTNNNVGIEIIPNATYNSFLISTAYNVSNALEFTPSTVAGGTTYSTPAMVIKNNGNIGVGTTNPTVPLHVYSAAGDSQILSETNATGGTARITIKSNGAGGGNFYFMTGDTTSTLSGRLRLWDSVAGQERLTVLPSGNIGIGTNNPSYQLQLSTDSAAKPSTNTWTIASDERVKNVTGEYTKGLDAICALRPITYEYNGKAGFIVDGKENISIIAQEAKEHFPECVGTFNAKLEETDEEETELYNWNGHAITFALINSVKELKAEIESLKAQLNA